MGTTLTEDDREKFNSYMDDAFELVTKISAIMDSYGHPPVVTFMTMAMMLHCEEQSTKQLLRDKAYFVMRVTLDILDELEIDKTRNAMN